MLRFRQLGANLIPQCYYYLRFFKLILTTIRNLVHSFTSTFSVEWMIEVLEFPVSTHVVSCWLSIDEGSSCSMYETDYHSSFLPLKTGRNFARCFCHRFIDEQHVGGTQGLNPWVVQCCGWIPLSKQVFLDVLGTCRWCSISSGGLNDEITL